MLSTVSWIGGDVQDGKGNWDKAANWLDSTGINRVPGSKDIVGIGTTTPVTIVIKPGETEQILSLGTESVDTLSIDGGTLMVTSGTSTLGGPLSMTGGLLSCIPTLKGIGASLTANGPTTVKDASLSAQGGGLISLPNLTSFDSDFSSFQADGVMPEFQANGTITKGPPSVLDVSALTSFTQKGPWAIDATDGGTVKLGGLTSLTSTIGISIEDLRHGTLDDGKVTTLSGVTAELDGTDPDVAASWTSFTAGSLTIYGNSLGSGYNLPGLTDVDDSNLDVQSGGQLALPNLTSYDSDETNFIADGDTTVNGGATVASLLDVSALTSFTQKNFWHLGTIHGGTLKLGGLTRLASTIGITIEDTGNSTLDDGNVTTLSRVSATLDGTDPNVAASWTSLTAGSLTVDGNSSGSGDNLPGLTDVDDSTLEALSGGQLALPNLISYDSNSTTFVADGRNSVLDVSALTSFTQTGPWTIEATNGGTVKLGGLTGLASTKGIFIDDTGGSALADGKLTTLSGVSVQLDGTDANVAASWTSFTAGSLTIYGNSSGSGYILPGLTDVDDSNLYVQAGGQLALPNLTSYDSNGTTFQAGGSRTNVNFLIVTIVASLLDVSALTGVRQTGPWNIEATDSGRLKLGGLTSLTSTRGISIEDVRNGILDNGKLTTLSGVTVALDGTYPSVADAWTTFTGGTLIGNGIPTTFPLLTDATINNLYLETNTTFDFPVLTRGSIPLASGYTVTIQNTLVTLPVSGSTGATINVPPSDGLTVVLQNSGTLSGGTTLNVGLGTNVVLLGGTYTGGVTFNVGAGASADLTGGATTVYSGTLAGSGGGAVELGSGALEAGSPGLTLNFLGSTFQWSGGSLYSTDNVTNEGTINVAGNRTEELYGGLTNSGAITVGAGSTLSVAGTFTQASTGTFDEQIGGTPTSGQFGRAAIDQSAALDGNFNLDLVNGYAPSGSQVYPVLTYASATGSFSQITGLPPNMTAAQTATAFDLVAKPLTIVSLGAIATNPRNVFMASDDVTFSEPINLTNFDLSAVTLTLNGGVNLINSGVTVSLLSGTTATYRIAGLDTLTTPEGTYVLTVDASKVQDLIGNDGTGTASVSWLMDTTPPTSSSVAPLPVRESSLTFSVTVNPGTDPLSGGVASGIVSYDIYVASAPAGSSSLSAFTLWTTVPASNLTATFTAQSNTTYAFHSIARDAAGNFEVKAGNIVEASTYVPDLTPPVTQINSDAADANGTFTLAFSGTSPGGSGVIWFTVAVQVDSNPAQQIGSFPGGSPVAGVYSGQAKYQGLTDGTQHTYTFSIYGINGNGVAETMHSAPPVTATFAVPDAPQITDFVVEKGLFERSYIRYLDVTFNEPVGQLTLDTGHVQLVHYALDGVTPLGSVSLANRISLVDHVMEIDFGAGGIGGKENLAALLTNLPSLEGDDGYYALTIDPDGTGLHDAVLHFYRLFGDVTGNASGGATQTGAASDGDLVGQVSSADVAAVTAALGQVSPNADINGSGTAVTLNDKLLVSKAVNRKLASGLSIDD
ncbi:MAG TPA: hypothetical protein VNH11_06170 [Pirellulales bacterium]|nr:hypothetical protein [Pirellulales bacterium]